MLTDDINETADFPQSSSDVLEQLMSFYGSAVLRTAFFYLGDRHLAEDISQEVFLRAHRGWARFRRESSVKTWLIKITVNLCRDKMRLKAFTEEPTDPLLLQRTNHIVEQNIIERLDKSIVLKNVLALPLVYQEVLYHYYYLDLTTKQLAKVTASSEGTVKSRLHRAREYLRERLEREGFEHG